ncbi:flagellin [Rhizobium sp. TRM95111]|uniref:flagellin N-terminal helical domain-containing protein n=1 Tax=Rhizobium alarense TaxID=2846851 RepID=UPI001F404D73|nr:flagellin [Rhizobium alarense]MCF3639017.1 flagellin [Rhizobium alarense]
MSSILTNVAAMAALSTLRSIDTGLETTQARVATGLRVGAAKDDAAYWSIATTMRSDNLALSAVQDTLGLGAAKVQTAYASMHSAIEVVQEIKAKLVAATEEGVDRSKVQDEIAQLQNQLVAIGDASSFSGENWLKADISAGGGTLGKNVVASFVRDESGNVSVKKIDYVLDASRVLFDEGGDLGILDGSTVIEGASVTVMVNVSGVVSEYSVASYTTDDVIAAGAGASTFDGSYATDGTDDYVKVGDDTWVLAVDQTTLTEQEVAFEDSGGNLWAVDLTSVAPSEIASVATFEVDALTSEAQFAGLVQMVDDALYLMTSAAADLGAIAMRIDMQEDFASSLSKSITSGVGRLVDADMNEESSRLKALQTQQQLAIQALSIANSSPETLMALFR